MNQPFPYISTQLKTLESNPLTIFRMAYLKSENKIILSGVPDNLLKFVSLNNDSLEIRNVASSILFNRPFALCVNKNNEIFLNCFETDIIAVFDLNMKKKREFKLKCDISSQVPMFTDLAIDNDSNCLYAADNNNNLVIILSNEGKESYISISSPFWLRVSQEKIFVVSSNILECLYNNEPPFSSLNKTSVSIFEKSTLTLIKRVSYENNIEFPRGIYLNENGNIVMAMVEKRLDKNQISYSYSLLVMDQNWRFIQKLKLDFRDFKTITQIFDVIVIGKKFLFAGDSLAQICLD